MIACSPLHILKTVLSIPRVRFRSAGARQRQATNQSRHIGILPYRNLRG
ncbi:MAG: hypothetical protein ACJAQW_002086, partial [Paracoccaceae bacterium]